MVSYGLLAQLVEQLTLNQRAAGSSPAQPTISKGLRESAVPFFMLNKLN